MDDLNAFMGYSQAARGLPEWALELRSALRQVSDNVPSGLALQLENDVRTVSKRISEIVGDDVRTQIVASLIDTIQHLQKPARHDTCSIEPQLS